MEVKIKKKCYFGEQGIAEVEKKSLKLGSFLSLSLFALLLKAMAQTDNVSKG